MKRRGGGQVAKFSSVLPASALRGITSYSWFNWWKSGIRLKNNLVCIYMWKKENHLHQQTLDLCAHTHTHRRGTKDKTSRLLSHDRNANFAGLFLKRYKWLISMGPLQNKQALCLGSARLLSCPLLWRLPPGSTGLADWWREDRRRPLVAICMKMNLRVMPSRGRGRDTDTDTSQQPLNRCDCDRHELGNEKMKKILQHFCSDVERKSSEWKKCLTN